jgi:hypothetical protein
MQPAVLHDAVAAVVGCAASTGEGDSVAGVVVDVRAVHRVGEARGVEPDEDHAEAVAVDVVAEHGVALAVTADDVHPGRGRRAGDGTVIEQVVVPLANAAMEVQHRRRATTDRSRAH